MCGRFTLHHDPAEIFDRFEIQGSLFAELTPRFNIAPSQAVAVITEHGPRRERLLEPMQWGLVPFWARDTELGKKLINARSETAAEKPSFKHALKRRRCLVPADGFYEWDRATKQPMHFRKKGGALFAFAGLFDEWQSPDGSALRSFTVLTTTPNPLVARIHDRMPVILKDADAEDAWLDVQGTPLDSLELFFAPLDAGEMDAYPVGKRVGSPVSDDPGLLTPLVGDSI
jgi:putative SOS response-associated peptidase YedK